MSDKEVIIGLLRRVEKRTRANRLWREGAAVLAVCLLFPIAFKLIDLAFPFRGRSVLLFLGLWAAATIAVLVWKLRGTEPLEQIAASVDRKVRRGDEMKTAYWFLRNPRPSPWVDVQIHRAAGNARRFDVAASYPRRFTNASLAAGGLGLLFVILNFLPLPWNHNWLFLQAEPAFRLGAAEAALVDQARQMLGNAPELADPEWARRIEEVLRSIEDGSLSMTDALQAITGIQEELATGQLDLGAIQRALEELAANLGQSDQLENASLSIAQGDLGAAAQELREMLERLGEAPPEVSERLQDALANAAGENIPGLEEITEALKNAAEALAQNDVAGAQEALESTAGAIEGLSEQIRMQEFADAAAEKLGELQEYLAQQQEGSESEQEADLGAPEAPPGGSETSAEQSASGESGDEGEGSEGEGDGVALAFEGGPGTGNSPAGTSDAADLPLFGDPTTLEVQLEKAGVSGRADEEFSEDLESASQRERSRRTYRQITSDLSPAQKDFLNQTTIPWEHRELTRQYFQAIRAENP